MNEHEACPSCGAAMATDQRYCLSCGGRHGDARIPFLAILRDRSPASAPAPVAVSARTAAAGVDRATLAWVAGVGCLLLALGIGVIIGSAGADEAAPVAAAPQVIRVQGGAEAAATGATEEAASPEKAARKKKRKAGSSEGAAATAQESKATNEALKDLNTGTPEQQQKKALKLPKTVGTGGKPPPKDDKAPAGGGGFQEIG